MGYLNLRPEQPDVFFRLMEERYRRQATIITTNLEYEHWQNFLGNKALCSAAFATTATPSVSRVPPLREPTG